MMTEEKQPALLPPALLPNGARLSAEHSLIAAAPLFAQYMEDQGFSQHTVKAFASDLRLLTKQLGAQRLLGDITTKELNGFFYWLAYERAVPCSPKSYSRRVTTVKVFFEWLQKSETLLIDPAKAVLQRSVTSPLPTLPTREQLAKALAVSEAWFKGSDTHKRDTRPHLLLTLLLKTGIKKGEAKAMMPKHLERDEEQPYLFVRYKNPRLTYKERKIPLDPAWFAILDDYLAQYNPPEEIFDCTPRNLEYVLRDINDAAELPKGMLSFENLRWASALYGYVDGEEPDHLRERLGLSKISWRETKKKLNQLVAKHELVMFKPQQEEDDSEEDRPITDANSESNNTTT